MASWPHKFRIALIIRNQLGNLSTVMVAICYPHGLSELISEAIFCDIAYEITILNLEEQRTSNYAYYI